MKHEVKKRVEVKIILQFFNDGGDEKGGDRNIWIRNISIKKMD